MKFDKLAACAFRLNERSRPAGVATGEWRRSAKAGISFFGSTVWVSSYALILLGTNASLAEDLGKAQQPTERVTAKMQPHNKMQPHKKREKTISKAKVQELAVKAPVVTDPAASAAALNKRYGIHGWNIPFPSYGDTLLQDAGGYRTELAKYGIGFIAWNSTITATNMLNTPTTNKGTQAYWGQRFGVANIFNPWLTYDLSQYGIPDGQIQVSGIFVNSSWQPYLPDTAQLARLSYYQTFLDKKLEMNIGIQGNGAAFIGVAVGGLIQSPFGPNASIPTELGLSSTSIVQPTAWFNYHITDNWYDTFAVMRSISPTASAFVDEQAKDPTGFDFSEKGANAVYLNELGYKQAATANRPMTWVRGGAVYNSSLYHDFATGGTSTKDGFYLLADQQILQLAPGSAPGRGWYVGASAMYTPPETSIFSQYYEGRIYAKGPFDARPSDFVSLVYSHNVISKFAADPINLTAALTGTFAQYSTNSLTLSYTARVTAGFYLTAGVGYTDHPSFTFIPKEGSALNFLASAFVAL
jgi:porin